MEKIGIIGAGNMGSGIVQKTAQEGLSVVMLDIKEEFVQRGMDSVRITLEQAVDRNILRAVQVAEIMGRIKGTTDMADVKDCDLVIEAVFEDMKVKKDLFANLDNICDEKTILATNTSSFSVDEMASATNRPDRFIGLHFFYHPAKNKLLEIIPGSRTSQETIQASETYSRLTRKTDIRVKDAPGFAVNRFFAPLMNEAFRILEEGIANIPSIDKAAMELLGIGMGPFLLVNVTGVPISYHTQNTLFEKLGSFYKPADNLLAQFESGDDWPLDGDVEEDKLEAVKDRLLGSIFYTTTSLLDEGIADTWNIDVGAKVGLRWSRGPFEIMNDLGIEKSYALVENVLQPFPDLEIPKVLKDQMRKEGSWPV